MTSSIAEGGSPFISLKTTNPDTVSNSNIKETIDKHFLSNIKIEPSNGDQSFDSQHSSGDDAATASASDRKFRRKNSRPQKVTSASSSSIANSPPPEDMHHLIVEHQQMQNHLRHQPLIMHPHPHHQLHQQQQQPVMVAMPQIDAGLSTAASAAALGLCETCGSPLVSVSTANNSSRPSNLGRDCDLIVLCVECTCEKISLLLEESERGPLLLQQAAGDAPTTAGGNVDCETTGEGNSSGGGGGSTSYVCRLCQSPKLFATSTDYLEHYIRSHEHPSSASSSSAVAVAASAGADPAEALVTAKTEAVTDEVAEASAAAAAAAEDLLDSESHRCSHCGLGLRSEDDVEQHERFHLECEFDSTRLRCYYCCKEFAELDALNAHQRAHSTERPHHCNVCDRAFSFACTLQRHMLVHQAFHSTYTCHYCDQTFTDAGQLDRHFDVCESNMDDAAGFTVGDGSKPGAPNRFLPYSHTCSTCGKSFRLAWRYKLHMRAACNTADKYNADSDRTCSICKKMFANPMNLHRHELIHAGIRNYQCKLCGKAFVQKTQLETHMNIHNGIKPFQCEVCNKNFTDRSTFHKHKKIHGKPKAFPCTVCGKVFNQAGYLKLHAKVHGSGGGGPPGMGAVVDPGNLGSGDGAASQQQQQVMSAAEYAVAAAAAAAAAVNGGSSVPPLTYCNLDIKLSM